MTLSLDRSIVYPDSDGQPMADNTLQFEWIVLLKENLEILFANDPQVFVAGDLLWYPVKGHPEIRVAPDVMVVFRRPKGYRGSYKQWEEEGVVPQVVFEILSPGNTVKEMAKKQAFYSRYGVEEYYLYDPDSNEFTALWRKEDDLEVIELAEDWVSSRLNIRFVQTEETLQVFYPDGNPFLSSIELSKQLEQSEARAQQEALRAEQSEARAQQEALRAEQSEAQLREEKQRSLRLIETLKSLGVDLDDF